MMRTQRLIGFGFLTTSLLALNTASTTVLAVPYTASYSDGETWDTIFGQGFNTYVNDLLPDQPYEFGETVPLTRWEFFKSGEMDSASNIQLAIIEAYLPNQTGIYADLTGLNANDPNGALVGLSTNAIASTASIPTGAPIRFNFDGGLDLLFGNYYGAIMVNVDESGNVTPVLVSALTADYIPGTLDPNGFIPETNYDISADPNGRLPTPEDDMSIDFNTSASNFMHTDEFGTFLDGFSGGGDANFVAYFDTTFPDIIPGDFDESGGVDGADLAKWEADYTVNGGSDADGDGDSDGDDFLIWQQNYGQGDVLSAVAAVPEPSAAALACALGAASALARGFRRRRELA